MRSQTNPSEPSFNASINLNPESWERSPSSCFPKTPCLFPKHLQPSLTGASREQGLFVFIILVAHSTVSYAKQAFKMLLIDSNRNKELWFNKMHTPFKKNQNFWSLTKRVCCLFLYFNFSITYDIQYSVSTQLFLCNFS